MARTKRSAAGAATTAADGDENAASNVPQTTPQPKRPRRTAASRSKASTQTTDNDTHPHAIDEPVAAPTAETVSVDQASIEVLSITFPSVGSSVYSKYLLPEEEEDELEPHLLEALENWDDGRDCVAVVSSGTPLAQSAASVLAEDNPDSSTDVLLLEQLVESTAYFPLPPELIEHHVDSVTGRYTGPKHAVVAELSQVLIQPVMTGRRPIIDPDTNAYVFAADTTLAHNPNYEPFEYTLPPSTDQAIVSSITLNSFKPVEQADPYHGRSSQVLRQGRKGERLNRATGFLHPLPSIEKEFYFRCLWVYPDSVYASLPVDVQPFVERQFTSTSDGVFHDGIWPSVMPFVRVVVRPIRGHKYPLPTNGSAKYTYVWSLFLRTNAINAAVESHDRAALTVIRDLLSIAVTDQYWLETLDTTDSDHFTSIPSTSDPEIASLAAPPTSVSLLVTSNLNDTQRICLAWLLKRELLDHRTVNVFPSITKINTHLVRLGPNGAYFEPFTSRFFAAAERDSIRVLDQPEPPISVACTDSILKTSGPFCPHKVGIILALIQSNPLQRPRPIPDLSRDLIPTRATLIVCTQANLAEWAVQAQRDFPRNGQVVVMDSSQDYTAVTLAQVQAADIVLVSDTFIFTIYNRTLRRMVNSEHAGSDSGSLMPRYNVALLNSISPKLQTHPPLLGCMDVSDDLPTKEGYSFFSRYDDYWSRYYDDRDLPHGFYDRYPRKTLAESFSQAQRAGTFLAEQAALRPDPAVHAPLHLLFWHRVVLDDMSFATSPSRADRRQHCTTPSSIYTPLRELAASATVIIVPTPAVSSSACSLSSLEPNTVNTLCSYRMLGINLPEFPSDNMPMSAQTSLLRSISLSTNVPALSTATPAVAVETIPVHLSLHEATRAAIVSGLVRDSLTLSVQAIQHHLIPLSFNDRLSASADHPRATTSVTYDSLSATQSSDMLFAKEWQQWHHLAAYRAKRRWPLYDDFLGPARPDRVVDPSLVDDWMPAAEHFAKAVKTAASFDANVHMGIRSIMSQTAVGVLATMRDSLQAFLTMSTSVAKHDKLFESTRAQLVGTRDKVSDRDCWWFRIGEMGLERGFTLKEIEAIGMAVSDERQVDANDEVKSSWRWFGYSYDKAKADSALMSSQPVHGGIVKILLELRLLLDLGRTITWAKASFRLLALALDGSDAPVAESSACRHCQQALGAETDALVRTVCRFNGCSACAVQHTASCQACQAGMDGGQAPMLPGHCPAARQRMDDDWVRLLHHHGASDSVDLFCKKLCGQQDDSSGSTTTPAFVDVFGAKVQAVIAYILQQLESNLDAKFVAFTEFTSQLYLLGLALHLVNIQAELIIDGASECPPILAFKTDPNVRVLIMPFSKCAAGISLSEASHILFVHPFTGESRSPWSRFGHLGFNFHHPAELPLSLSTAEEAKLNKKRMRVWAEWEQQCIEMVVKGGNQHAVVRIARFVIQHSIEQEFELDVSQFNDVGGDVAQG